MHARFACACPCNRHACLFAGLGARLPVGPAAFAQLSPEHSALFLCVCCTLFRKQENFDIVELLPVLLLGIIGGLLGSTFTYLNEGLTAWRKKGVCE